jgi:D-sedoheptulose 7-phosphate isomerase
MPLPEISRAIDLLLECYRRGNTVFAVGNGGSATTASHLACDLAKGARIPGQPPLRVIALTDSISIITAWANDTNYSNVFAGQLESLVGPNDVLVVFSGSGKSSNVLRAAEVARERGAASIGLTGGDGGLLQGSVDVCISVPSCNMPQIEDLHLAVAHLIASEVRHRIAVGSRQRVGVSEGEGQRGLA